MGGNLRRDLSHVKGRLSPLGGYLSHMRGCLSLFGGVWATLEGD